MNNNNSLEYFLLKNHINKDTWENARIEWSILQAIATDHQAESQRLGNIANSIANEIQKFDKVHSVRWRVKDSDHLLEKIVRKRAENNEKYENISLDNYYECVSDLVGIRALHLFKRDCFEIVFSLKKLWNQIETPVAYVRSGDSDEFDLMFRSNGFEVKVHPAGYRSIHYVFESHPNKRKLVTEVQVRTIFEEGWSEIDHKIRYPNFSDNKLVGYFLAIFNRLAGNADEMGGFILGLDAYLSELEKQTATAIKEKNATLREMEKALNQLGSVEKQNQNSNDIIDRLKAEVTKLKSTKDLGLLTSSPNGGIFGLMHDPSLSAAREAQKQNTGILGLMHDPSLSVALEAQKQHTGISGLMHHPSLSVALEAQKQHIGISGLMHDPFPLKE